MSPPFRYSGNKEKIVKLLTRPLPTYKRVAELYFGSGAFARSQNLPAIGYEKNKNVVDLWNWLKTVSPEELYSLRTLVESHKDKIDIRSLKLSPGAETYVRINVSGVYVGQLSSWVLYPQHKLPIEKTIASLEKVHSIDIIHGNCHTDYKEQDGDLVFLDPPYKNTFANYKENAKNGIEEEYHPNQTREMIQRIKSPIIFTYGTDAQAIFPEFEWQVVLRKKVPIIRGGGTKDRIEHVAYINF